ncbi:hypothetical protein [Haladaptatus sp. NG-WS-4]
MSHCPDCGKAVDELVKSDASAGAFLRAKKTVWDCPHCGAILGVSGAT